MKTKTIKQNVLIPDGNGGIREIVTVRVKAEFDDRSGEYFLSDDALRELDRVKARYMGLLLPSEIKELRQRFNKTQADMCSILGLGAKTWTRWETGAERPLPFYAKVLVALYEGRQSLDSLCAQRGKCRMWFNLPEKMCYSCSGLAEQFSNGFTNKSHVKRRSYNEAGYLQAVA